MSDTCIVACMLKIDVSNVCQDESDDTALQTEDSKKTQYWLSDIQHSDVGLTLKQHWANFSLE